MLRDDIDGEAAAATTAATAAAADRSLGMATPSAPTEAEDSLASARRSPLRPGSRQRRAMHAANSTTTMMTATTHERRSHSPPHISAATSTSPSIAHQQTLEWTENERREAMTLINEMAQAGVAPVELIAQGIRADVVHASCQALNIPLGGFGGSSSRVHEDEATSASTTTTRSRRKRSKKNSNGSAAKAKQSTSQRFPAAVKAVEEEENAEEMFELLRQKVALERERAILMRMERKRNEEQRIRGAEAAEELEEGQVLTLGPTPDVASAPARIVQSDPMQAMREAALASMKRRRSPADGSGTKTENNYTSPPPPPQQQQLPPNVPRGPKALYHDIDAPQLDAAQREREAAEALLSSYDAVEEQELQHVQSQRSRDTAASRRSRPISYVDEDFRYESGAPAGQVDYTAPLPSLMVARKGIDVQQKVSEPILAPRPPAPFLVLDGHQRVVVEFSDSEGEDDEINAHAKQTRRENTQSILQAWQRERGYVQKSVSPADVNGTSTPSSGETRALLESKEKEIERLKEKMRLLEERRKQPSTTVNSAAATLTASPSASDPDLSSEQQQQVEEQQQQQRKEEGFPTYESPFARFPGLRRLVEQRQSQNGESS